MRRALDKLVAVSGWAMIPDEIFHIAEACVAYAPEALGAYRRDESHIIGPLPLAVLKPHGPNALRELVQIAKGEGLNLVPRGTGTGKAGGAVPTRSSIVVDLSEYPGEIEVSPAEMVLAAPASALLKEVKAAAGGCSLFYPPDPNSWDQCSFGGSLATNAGGPSACKYGVSRHWVLSVDALMEDGEIHRLGAGLIKDNAGPSLAQLMVGSEGIFGIITSAKVRLIPAPQERAALLLPVERWGDLLGLPALLAGQGLLPSAFEFWDPQVLRCLRLHGPEEARRLPGEALALIEFDDAGCADGAFLEKLMDILGPFSESALLATGASQREEIWDVRRQTSAVLKEQFPNKVSEDIAVPRSKIKEFFEGAEKLELPIAAYGHLGDGNIHVNILINNDETKTKKIAMSVFRLAIDLGGSLTGEHGIGLAKREAFLGLADPWQIEAIRSLKKALDPGGIFNAGKVV